MLLAQRKALLGDNTLYPLLFLFSKHLFYENRPILNVYKLLFKTQRSLLFSINNFRQLLKQIVLCPD
ncbi:hypothetical protein ADH74_16620 [Bacteroides caecimuris]|uniref:Uncharacterized protein n=1 Tax=Bacteroides caecimuris TaxID=1796613 RepID=A0A1V0QD76_9BACE|nr:hypothetical protein A4V03_20455 [Bacteroides caecimuris]NDO59750.1 hypothetical protein [Bacteroides caecimuris]OXE62285.1 hypothetical protein ADH74_16620 [Bacteroides caecimuris]